MAKYIDHMTEPELHVMMNRVADAVEEIVRPHGACFIVLVAPMEGNTSAQYVASAEPEGCIAWLRETADRLEARDHVPRDPP